jgi:hypothetical protein
MMNKESSVLFKTKLSKENDQKTGLHRSKESNQAHCLASNYLALGMVFHNIEGKGMKLTAIT